MGTLRTIGSISRDRHIFCGLTGRRFTQHRQKPSRGEGVRVGPWPNSDSFPLQLAILPWYSVGLVLKSKFLSVGTARIRLSMSAKHQRADLEQAAATITRAVAK